MGRTTTKIDEHIMNRVRKHTKKNFLTVSGFINATLQRELDMIDEKTSYSSSMNYLIKESNKKKK